MRILILEDDPERMKTFRRSAEMCSGNGHSIEIIHHDTAWECIQDMNRLDFDLVFLDHDLDGRVYVQTTDPNCGTRVALFLEEWRDVRARHGKVIVHSFNEGAAKGMVALVPNSEWIPGAWMLENFEPIVAAKKREMQRAKGGE